MPELPEVQTTVNQLKVFEKKHLINIQVHDFKLIAQKTLDSLKDKILLSIIRRGKYLHFTFEKTSLIVHLRMTGAVSDQTKKRKARSCNFFLFFSIFAFF
jgi:formamidopyrimidine-DNA glycosylase